VANGRAAVARRSKSSACLNAGRGRLTSFACSWGVSSVAEAIALLEGYGFQRAPNGDYVLSDDDELQLLAQVADEVSRSRLSLDDPQSRARERVERALETGDLPPWSPF
jgi:hypothetical protein